MTSTNYELQVWAEGELSCDGSACDDDCPIHGTPNPSTSAPEETDQ